MMLLVNRKYTGKEIKAAAKDSVVNVMAKDVRIPISKINDFGVYSFVMKEDRITIQQHTNSWGCQKEHYEKIIADGQKLIDNMFKDVLDMTKKNIK